LNLSFLLGQNRICHLLENYILDSTGHPDRIQAQKIIFEKRIS